MKRRVIKLGPATLVVSLPSKWVREFGIKAGEDLELEEQKNVLIIKTKGEFKIEKERVDFTKISHLIKRIIASKYIKGCDEVDVYFDSLEKARVIQKRVDEMIGMEVIEQGKNFLKLKDLVGVEEENFDKVLRRVLHLLHSMADESLEAIKKGETNLEYIADMEAHLNRFTDHCFRLLNKKGYVDYRKTAVMYLIVYLLESLGDEYKKLVGFITKKRLKLDKDIVKVYNDINIYFKEFEDCFLSFSYEKTISLANKRDNIVNHINDLIEKKRNSNDVIILKNFSWITDNIINVVFELLTLH